MYSRKFICDGDTTQSGGKAHAKKQEFPMTFGNDAKNICFEGDDVFCPACNSMGKTKCVMPYRPWTGPDGRQVNLDGDLCLCKCHNPPRLVSDPTTTMSMSFSAHEFGSMAGVSAWLSYAGHTTRAPSNPAEKFERIFHFKDNETGQPLAHCNFIINDGGKTYEGKTNANGDLIVEISSDRTTSIQLMS